MTSPASRQPSWLRRQSIGMGLELRRLLRKLLNLDSDRDALEAAIVRMDRRLEEFSGNTGRVAVLERRLQMLTDTVSTAEANLSATLESSASAIGQTFVAVESVAGAVRSSTETTTAALQTSAAGLDTGLRAAISATNSEIQAGLAGSSAGLLSAISATDSEVRAAAAGLSTELLAAISAAQSEVRAAINTEVRASASALDDAMRTSASALRSQTMAALSDHREALASSTAKAIAQNDQLAEQLAAILTRAQSLDIPFQDLFNRARFLEMAACNMPIYTQAGLTAIVRVGGWDGLPIAVPSSHVGVLQTYHASGPFNAEPGVRALIYRELRPEDSAVDIGAHVGLHAVVMGSIVREKGRLVCFEPDPDLAAALMQTLIMNGLTRNGAIVNAAVTERDGTHEFHRTLHSPESSLFGESDAPARDVVKVNTVSLDSYFRAGDKVDFAKIDAEGAEPAILRGMRRVLADNPGLRMIMEFAPEHMQRAGEDAGAFFDTMLAMGYSAEIIDDHSGAVSSASRDRVLSERTHNLWLKPTGVVSASKGRRTGAAAPATHATN